MDERGVYFPDNISGPNDGQYVFPVIHPTTEREVKMPASGWRFPRDEMTRRVKLNLIHFGPDETTVPNNKTYLADTETTGLTSVRFVDGRAASKRLHALFGKKVFTNPKDELLLADIYAALDVGDEDIILDMFSGSGSALHAAWVRAHRGQPAPSFIGIQIAEDLRESLKTAQGAAKKITRDAISLLEGKGRPAAVSEITKERLRLAARQIQATPSEPAAAHDLGFRALCIDTTNMNETTLTPSAYDQDNVMEFVSSVKSGRTAEDLLFQVMLDWGLGLSLPIERTTIAGREVFIVDGGALIACFDGTATDELAREIAALQPLRAVFRDSAFTSDALRINVEQIFTEHSSVTDVKVI